MSQQQSWEAMKKASDLLVDFVESYNDRHPLKGADYRKDLEDAFNVMMDAKSLLTREVFRLQKEQFEKDGSFFESSVENT